MFFVCGKSNRRGLRVLVLAVAAVLSACAGPSSESKEVPRGVAQYQDPNGCSYLTGEACEIFKGANFQRVKNKLPVLKISARCQAVAESHAADMAKNRYLDHVSPKHGDFMSRATKAGLLGFVGENIAAGYDASGAMNAWMNSSPHRANLLDPRFVSTGVAVAVDRNGRPYYAQCFSDEADL
ncbi:MAG: CAP domain-containing protein [Bdellovibrionaceae bacterium]|nr:CAP domain-containing protein [Pseudobdellovibrionaceae bacterium]